MKTLSIIVPVYNEEKTVKQIIDKLLKLKLPNEIEKEIVIIDDGSYDKTSEILKQLRHRLTKVVTLPSNQGKGSAVRRGFLESSGDFIIIQDADLEYNPDDFTSLLGPILSKQARVVYGTRFRDYPLVLFGKNKTILPTHWLANKFLTLLTNILYGANITDMETCYKLFTKSVLSKLKLKSRKFDIEPEITAKLLKNGYQITEVPIRAHPRTYEEGKKINWRDGVVALWTLVKYRFTG